MLSWFNHLYKAVTSQLEGVVLLVEVRETLTTATSYFMVRMIKPDLE